MKEKLLNLDDAVGPEVLRLRTLAFLVANAEDGIDETQCDGLALLIEGAASKISEAVKKARRVE